MKSWRLCEREEDVVNTGGIRWRKRKWEEEEERQGEEERGGFPDEPEKQQAPPQGGATESAKMQMCSQAPPSPLPPPNLVANRYEKKLGVRIEGTQLKWRYDQNSGMGRR